jgi:hypothetical protein
VLKCHKIHDPHHLKVSTCLWYVMHISS